MSPEEEFESTLIPPDVHINERRPDHNFELILVGAFHGAAVHTYFHTLQAAMRNLAFSHAGTKWKLIDLHPERAEVIGEWSDTPDAH
jgi:hypothetical protein